jgi:hypothetical protein
MNQKNLAVIFFSYIFMLTSVLNGMDVIEYRKPSPDKNAINAVDEAGVVTIYGGLGAAVGAAAGGLLAGPPGAVLVGALCGAGAASPIIKEIKNERAVAQKKIEAEECPIALTINHRWKEPSRAIYDAYLQFNAGKQPLVIARAPFNYETEKATLQSAITAQLLSLRQALGKPTDGQGNYVALTNSIYINDLASAIANPSELHAGAITVYAKHLEAFPGALEALQKLAVLSSAPSQDSQFKDTLRNFMAHAIWISVLANHHPLREKYLTTNNDLAEAKAFSNRVANYWSQEVLKRSQLEREKEACQAEFRQERDVRNRLQLDYNAKNAEFIAERNTRNRLQTEADTERAQKAQLQVQLVQTQQRSQLLQEASTAQKFQAYEELAKLDAQHEDLKKVTAQRDQTALAAALEIAALEENLMEENANLRTANENLYKTMAEQSQQGANDYMAVRSQISPLRKRAAQVQDLQNATLQKLIEERAKNAALTAQLEALKTALSQYPNVNKK